MENRPLLSIVIIAVITVIVVVVILKLLGHSSPVSTGWAVAGGIAGALVGTLFKEKNDWYFNVFNKIYLKQNPLQ